MPAKPLSKEQLADAARLKEKFREWQSVRAKSGKPFSQEYCSEQLQMGQSAINQYLNGKIPLNLKTVTKFSHLLGVPVQQLSPALAIEVEKIAAAPYPNSVLSLVPGWPFPEIDREKLERLDERSLMRLEGAILTAAKQLELDIRKK